VWHIGTKKGPYVVLEDEPRRDIVYVDTKPANPATIKDLGQSGYDRKQISLGHRHVAHYYRSMLTDIEPPKVPHWTTQVDWGRLGRGIGAGIVLAILVIFLIVCCWGSIGAPVPG
jgi:hypothetical protein